ncbi:hypothetical protein PV08_05182 [Exophiala spinifera]|uniref:Zn(2)-C6 fungal-type domain-containing protein n=1 Tax=Exophiala spinifera TaxID=91928 RepID=A0A0D1ZQR7_9EURO|nr:uncharacterized protein PV08_05182 [Exophiala spinifera]KIW15137.1 hypothetical protein PV08_05182 [Exophiala spinifera]
MADRSDGSGVPTQRRVRTGCLTCRKRRRKCDEGKPTCKNCVDKSLSCRYGLNITFVDGTPNESTATSHKTARQTTTRSVKATWINGPTREDSRPLVLSNDPVTTLWSGPDIFPIGSVSREQFTETSDRSNLLAGSPVLHDFDQGDTPSAFSHQLPALLDTSPALRSGQGDVAELDLLTFYRYEIAARLDLGVGRLYFGVHVLTRALSEVSLYQSILALARAYAGNKSPLGKGTGEEDDAAQANRAALVADPEDSAAIFTILTLRKLHDAPPCVWHECMTNALETTHISLDQCVDEQWQLLARLALAASLTAPSASQSIRLSFILQRATPIIPDQVLTQHQQLQQALVNLARALVITRRDTGARLSAGRLPLISSWQSCWSDNQLWYSARREDMKQILEVGEFDPRLSVANNTQVPFPILAFSNLCSLVGNLTHHLTALLLLQFKPRAIRALPEQGSSTSPIWHAQRMIGMVVSVHERDVFDPLVIAGLVYAARRLSHPSQTTVVVNILKKVMERTGMQLQGEVEKLDTGQANSFG